jgi:hypothetical protein
MGAAAARTSPATRKTSRSLSSGSPRTVTRPDSRSVRTAADTHSSSRGSLGTCERLTSSRTSASLTNTSGPRRSRGSLSCRGSWTAMERSPRGGSSSSATRTRGSSLAWSPCCHRWVSSVASSGDPRAKRAFAEPRTCPSSASPARASGFLLTGLSETGATSRMSRASTPSMSDASRLTPRTTPSLSPSTSFAPTTAECSPRPPRGSVPNGSRRRRS